MVKVKRRIILFIYLNIEEKEHYSSGNISRAHNLVERTEFHHFKRKAQVERSSLQPNIWPNSTVVIHPYPLGLCTHTRPLYLRLTIEVYSRRCMLWFHSRVFKDG